MIKCNLRCISVYRLQSTIVGKSGLELETASALTSAVKSRDKCTHVFICLAAYAQLLLSIQTQFRIPRLGDGAAHAWLAVLTSVNLREEPPPPDVPTGQLGIDRLSLRLSLQVLQIVLSWQLKQRIVLNKAVLCLVSTLNTASDPRLPFSKSSTPP